jgi:hypothetical protein
MREHSSMMPLVSAETEALGSLSAIYRFEVWPEMRRYLSILCTGLTLGICFIIGSDWELYSLHLTATASSSTFDFVLLVLFFVTVSVFLFVCMGGLFRMLWKLQHSIWQIQLYELGFVYIEGKKTRIVRWSEVMTIRRKLSKYFAVYGLPLNNRNPGLPFCTLRTRQGKIYTFDNTFQLLDQVGEASAGNSTCVDFLEKEVTRHLLPVAVAAYESGQQMAFGKLRITNEGIKQGKVLLPWPLVARVALEPVKIAEGIPLTSQDLLPDLVIYQQGEADKAWYPASVSKIPNVAVFVALAEYIREHS